MYWSAGCSQFSIMFNPFCGQAALPRLAAARRAGGHCGALFGFVLVEHCASGGAALFGELVAVFAAPVVGPDARDVVAAEMRHHVARVELVGAFGLLPIGPV